MGKKKDRENKAPPQAGAEIDEPTVFFEVVLPELCEKYAAYLQRLAGVVELQLRARPPRVYHVIGGEPPWLRLGSAPEGRRTLILAFSLDFVKLMVHGGVPNIEAAMAAGQLSIEGDVEILKPFVGDLKLP